MNDPWAKATRAFFTFRQAAITPAELDTRLAAGRAKPPPEAAQASLDALSTAAADRASRRRS